MKSYFLAPLILQKFIWLPTRFLLIIFGRLRVYGLENIKNLPTPIIFACNHSSEIDPFMVPASLPLFSCFSPIFHATRERDFYSTNGWRKYLFGGLFIKAWGGYTTYSGLKDYEKSLSSHIEIILEGGSFCVFPEGGITKDGNIQPAHGGIAYLAEKAKCGIVPVAISGVYGMSVKDFFSNLFTNKREITVHFGKVITQDELLNNIARSVHQGENVYKKEAEYVMDKVRKLSTVS